MRFLALSWLFVLAASGQQYDLVIQGGRVIDPAAEIDGVMDVAVKDGKIARVAEDIPADQAKKAIDASGAIVTPGLIDLHAHVDGTEGSEAEATGQDVAEEVVDREEELRARRRVLCSREPSRFATRGRSSRNRPL